MKRLLLLALTVVPLCADETRRLDTFKKNLSHAGWATLTTLTGVGQILAAKAFRGSPDALHKATPFESMLGKNIRFPMTTLYGAVSLNALASIVRAEKTQEFYPLPALERILGPTCITLSILMPRGDTLDEINSYRKLLDKAPLVKTATRQFFNTTKRALLAAPKVALGAYGLSMWSGNQRTR